MSATQGFLKPFIRTTVSNPLSPLWRYRNRSFSERVETWFRASLATE